MPKVYPLGPHYAGVYFFRLYIMESIRVLWLILAIRGPTERQVIRHLILVNIVIVVMDVLRSTRIGRPNRRMGIIRGCAGTVMLAKSAFERLVH